MANNADLVAITALFQRTDGTGTFDLTFYSLENGLGQSRLEEIAVAALAAQAETILDVNEDPSDYTLIRVAYDWPKNTVLILGD